MAQGWKAFFIGAATTVATSLGLKAEENHGTDFSGNNDGKADKTVLAKDTVNHDDSIPGPFLADSVSRDDLKAHIDTIRHKSMYHPKFDAAREDAFYLILHFEDVTVYPYKLPGENFYTYGIGNTLNEHGKPVKANEKIRDLDHLMEVMNVHINNRIYPKMVETFDLDSLKQQEIAILCSIAYNAGEGYLSELKPYVDNYIKDRNNPVAKKKLTDKIKKRNKGRNGKIIQALVARRDFDCRVITGDIVLCTGRECTEPNELNLKDVVVGGWSNAYYMDERKRKSTRAICTKSNEQVCDSIRDCRGQTPWERIDTALSKPRPTAKKKTAPKSKTSTKKRSVAKASIPTMRASRGR